MLLILAAPFGEPPIHINYIILIGAGQVPCPERRIIMLTKENTFVEYPDIVSPKQLMQMLHIGRNKAFKLLNGDIPSIRIGKNHKIPKIYVIEYLNKHSMDN